jgi:iron complex transport system substrate-binding protein
VFQAATAHIRRRWLPCVALAVVLMAAVGCGGSDSSTEKEPDGAGGKAGTEAGAFPVTIEHKYGETTLESRPERVVTVGLTDHDSVLALGVVPVGVTDWFGEHPSAAWPWAQDELGNGESEIVGTVDAIGFEKVAAARPDVILALYAGITDSDYDKLSQIAPTVAQPKGQVDYGIPWQQQTEIVGQVLGENDKAEALVADVEQRLADAKEQHPEFDGAVGMVAVPYQGVISVYAPDDVRGRFMSALGFVQPSEIEELAGDDFSAELSDERIDLLDVDALVWIVNDVETDPPKFDEQPLYANLDVHKEGHEVFVANLDELGGALSFQSVLSLPFLVDELVPKLADAVAGTPPG